MRNQIPNRQNHKKSKESREKGARNPKRGKGERRRNRWRGRRWNKKSIWGS